MYAPDDAGHDAVDAISAALLVKAGRVARGIRKTSIAMDQAVRELDFHTTSFHGGYGRDLQAGQLVEVHMNSDDKLVAVWYQRRQKER